MSFHRRHAKAVQRRKMLLERRRLEAGGNRSPDQDARRAAAAPLHACYVQDSVFVSGVGMVFLIRKTGVLNYTLGGFLVDSYCLGVKDAMLREVDAHELKRLIDEVGETSRLAPVEPSYARKLLRDAVAYARSLGLPPHEDYAEVEPLFGDVEAEACEVRFAFGYEGRPLYVPGPTESPTQIRRRIERLARKLGIDGFDFGMPEGAFDAGDDEEDDVSVGYDPDVPPDAAEWTALPEHERIRRVRDLHGRIGHPNARLHAVVHDIIEMQIALDAPPSVRRAIERLIAEGVGRHEAVHALGATITDHILEAGMPSTDKRFPMEAYNDAVERLTAAEWRRQTEDARAERTGSDDRVSA